ncbi:PREDICTED: carboxypeptidase N subunit 2-like [Branchiostoma belcheri]|uniref:Carboxypeptidase N subunit 2-like n=1 Tax=Branchiostoma belcheri TaxID=7741 RepID=A0A6P5ANV2_BRABE|nr:PREDICTED: carboxypeptidase N subunit 2-like [Branchiostoma belcheri]
MKSKGHPAGLWLLYVYGILLLLPCANSATLPCLQACQCYQHEVYGKTMNCARKGMHMPPPSIPNPTRKLVLQYNSIHMVNHTLNGPGYSLLYYLDLSGNQMVDLDRDAFANTTELMDLDLHFNRLRFLHKSIFRPMKKLRWLHLYGNALTFLEPDLFAGLTKLDGIYLGWNKIRSLPMGIFKNLPSLQYLYLHDNQIKYLNLGLFEDLIQLYDLNLGGNHLSSLPLGIFKPLRNLMRLFLYQNRFYRLEEGVFTGLDRVELLWFHGNKLAMLPRKVFSDLPKLQVIELDANLLEMFYGDALRQNKGLAQLEILLLQKNNLYELPNNAFHELHQLSHLDLSDNYIRAVQEGAFNGLRSLTQLSLQGNKLRQIPEAAFYGLESLSHLVLASNVLEKLPGRMLHGQSQLLELLLENNQITDIPESFLEDCLSLEKLSISNNRLSSLSKDVLALPPLTRVQLQGNPWKCDCHLKWLREWMSTTAVDYRPAYGVSKVASCSSPLQHAGKPIITVSAKDFVCKNSENQLKEDVDSKDIDSETASNIIYREGLLPIIVIETMEPVHSGDGE